MSSKIMLSNLLTDVVISVITNEVLANITLYDTVDHEKLTIEVYPASSKITITREGL